jgi:uncharacterized membrane protein YfcA
LSPVSDEATLAALFLVVAALFASVGQAGASGYLAAMAAFGLPPEVMKPTALALNVLVSAIGTALFLRAGLLSWRSFYPFAVLGFPFSLIGGAISLPGGLYYPAVGAVLVASAALMLRRRRPGDGAPAEPPFLPALLVGAGIGLVSGTTGTGGGVFLAPVILALNWVPPRRTAAVTAAYNLLNSGAALNGAAATLGDLPPALPLWLVAAGIGGLAGALIGSGLMPERGLRLVLALVLFGSGLRLILV